MTTNGDVLIRVENLQKAFGDFHALNGITEEIHKGEVVVIIGPSGSGKSTFLRSLNLLEVPTGGHIYFEGVDITDKHVDINKHRQKMGMVFQHFNLFNNLTVKDNIMLGPVKQKLMTKEEAEAEALRLLKLVNLEEKADAYPAQLSGGEQQRVSIARALAKNPKLLLCDEPTGALDYNTGKAILKLLQNMCREKGMTVIVITHNQALAPMADRLIHIKNGQVSKMQVNDNPGSIDEIAW